MADNESRRVTGPFTTSMVPPEPPYASVGSMSLGRMTINKVFEGELSGTSTVEMLTAMSGSVQGSGAYVAIERVTATLEGRSGTFIFQHNGTMTRGAGALTVTVVPDSGAGELEGLSGTMQIDIVEGKHSYTFDYLLEPAATDR